jgi:hypothetical protein
LYAPFYARAPRPKKAVYIFSGLDVDRCCEFREKDRDLGAREEQARVVEEWQDGSENRHRKYAIAADYPLLPLDLLISTES